jgi:hypothetical protein
VLYLSSEKRMEEKSDERLARAWEGTEAFYQSSDFSGGNKDIERERRGSKGDSDSSEGP